MWELDKNVWSTWLPLDLKLRLYNACILSIFLYGSETWSLTATEEKEIDALDKWCLRRTCGIKWNDFVMNEEVWRRTNQLPLTSIMRRRLGLFDHVARLDLANDTRHALAAPTPSQWKRPPRRPRNCWLSVVSKDVGIPDAMTMAEDRMRWKKVVAAHATPQEDMLPE